MTSTFSWLDFSEQQRRQALDVLDLFREQDTRDELGIGTIRDALADLLFPGTSTIQTRARYFLFIPWLYLRLEHRGVRSDKVADRIRTDEVKLIYALADSDDRDGIIGVEAREKLKRLPSNVYWQGLLRWGIRLYPGSQEQYHRSLDAFYAAVDRRDSEEDHLHSNWHVSIPAAPAGFPEQASFHMTMDEASYLHDRIMASCRGSLLAYLVDQPEGDDPEADFPWQHRMTEGLPARLAGSLTHARNFSDVMHGAALLYNLMLAEQERSELVEFYTNWLTEWWYQTLQPRAAGLAAWEREPFWAVVRGGGARIPIQTQGFVQFWADRVIRGLTAGERVEELLADSQVRGQLRARETSIKGSQARLTNKHARELWQGQSGAGQLAFRWATARTLISDIRTGLNGGGKDA